MQNWFFFLHTWKDLCLNVTIIILFTHIHISPFSFKTIRNKVWLQLEQIYSHLDLFQISLYLI